MSSLLFVILAFFLIRLFTSKNFSTNFLFICVILFLVISIIIYPKVSVDTALEAVKTWLFVVIPSLFPFFIGAELLIHSGFIDFIGVIFGPIMYPLFRVPGSGSFVFAMSVTSGYPVGASLVSDLRKSNSISKDEAQRMVSFSSTSGPLFIIGAVSVGMLNNPSVGVLLSLAHYASALTIGLLFRYYGTSKREKIPSKSSYFKSSLNALESLKEKKLTSISTIMSRSIESAFNSMFMVGGFIIIYSVIIKILNITNVIPFLSQAISSVIPLNLDVDIVSYFLSGLIELTNGCKELSLLSVNFVWKLSMISFLIGWGGLSVHSQAISFMSKTDINIPLYLFSKAIHGFISSIYTYFLYLYIFKDKIGFVEVSSQVNASIFSSFIELLKLSLRLELILILIFSVLILILGLFFSLKYLRKKIFKL